MKDYKHKCFQAAYDAANTLYDAGNEPVIVHGYAKLNASHWFIHAWCESDGKIYDYTRRPEPFIKDKYYSKFKVSKLTRRYHDFIIYNEMIADHMDWGPFDKLFLLTGDVQTKDPVLCDIKMPFMYICSTYFPRWKQAKEWRVEVDSQLPSLGLCDPQTKTICVQYYSWSFEFELLLIHEICHAVTDDSHGEKFFTRMEKAAEKARDIGNDDLSRMLFQEVAGLRQAPKAMARDAYTSIENAVMDNPHLSYDAVIKWVANDWGFYPHEFEKRFKLSRTVYNQAVKDFG